MHASGVGNVGEALQSVTDHHAGGIKASFAEAEKRHTKETDDTAELQAHQLSLRGGLDRSDERRLARRASPALVAQAFAAEIGVNGPDLSAQRLRRIAVNHDLLHLVLDHSSHDLRDAEVTAQLNAENILHALRAKIDRAKPRAQHLLRRGEDRFCNRRGLPAAGGAL